MNKKAKKKAWKNAEKNAYEVGPVAVLGVNGDLEDIPEIPLTHTCRGCGRPAPLFSCSTKPCAPEFRLNYKYERLRVVVKCENCGVLSGYRLGWWVVKDGSFVKEE